MLNSLHVAIIYYLLIQLQAQHATIWHEKTIKLNRVTYSALIKKTKEKSGESQQTVQ